MVRCVFGGWETTGHGIIRPRRWPAAPLDSVPPPNAKRRATRGAASDGPSVRFTPTGVRPSLRTAPRVAALRLTSQPCHHRRRTSRSRSRSEREPPRIHLLSGVRACCASNRVAPSSAYQPALPPPSPNIEITIAIRRRASISHPACLVVCVWVARWLRAPRRRLGTAAVMPFALRGRTEAASARDGP